MLQPYGVFLHNKHFLQKLLQFNSLSLNRSVLGLKKVLLNSKTIKANKRQFIFRCIKCLRPDKMMGERENDTKRKTCQNERERERGVFVSAFLYLFCCIPQKGSFFLLFSHRNFYPFSTFTRNMKILQLEARRQSNVKLKTGLVVVVVNCTTIFLLYINIQY